MHSVIFISSLLRVPSAVVNHPQTYHLLQRLLFQRMHLRERNKFQSLEVPFLAIPLINRHWCICQILSLSCLCYTPFIIPLSSSTLSISPTNTQHSNIQRTVRRTEQAPAVPDTAVVQRQRTNTRILLLSEVQNRQLLGYSSSHTPKTTLLIANSLRFTALCRNNLHKNFLHFLLLETCHALIIQSVVIYHSGHTSLSPV